MAGQYVKQGKLSRSVSLREAAKVGVGFQDRLVDIQEAERYEKQVAVQEHVASDLGALPKLLPMKSFPEVEEFLGKFGPGARFRRRPVLVIVGGTNSGKSLLAAAVLQRLADMLRLPGYLEVTVEHSERLDMSEFDHRAHAGVLLDGVGDAMLLHENKEMLQGRPKVCKGAQSPTMAYAYSFALCRPGVVASMDLSADNLAMLEQDHWLSDRHNVIKLRLTEKAFLEAAPETPPLIETPRAVSEQGPRQKRRWGSPAAEVGQEVE